MTLLVFISLTSMLYAFVQKAEADKKRIQVEENHQKAVQPNKVAEEQKQLAEECRQMLESMKNRAQ